MNEAGFTIKCNKCGTEVQVLTSSPYPGNENIVINIQDDYTPAEGKMIVLWCKQCNNETK